ncbi:peptidoglycan DD-metalloendopeptidase family protein [Advenella alkanexedens]|uniref:Peptidoglycan DD-metalloendopeptidase family protein n=1 Tax=Advenella alkanexedens TaxID=1481665 RepID=A0ABS6NL01_9BURK|nr:peptidoglycan DD-metalloendopeptidase family protein [Advenella sp.]MBV4396308.1 peptidoglycan DD-metalloendopeptidase family protein [Advenella alkanexedens]MDD3757491.1 peptidoglycan DD-metalloendopeptidase family protein [Advenella sp.]NLN67529.1 peptidoglycan DD-metalloendopeptidase family protein [Alcaligenaceae bacterium]
MTRWVICISLFVLLGTGPVMAQTTAALSEQQKTAEKQKARLQNQIEEIQKKIKAQESDKQDVTDELRKSETEISKINARLDDLQAQGKRAKKELGELRKQQDRQQKIMELRREELAAQMRTQYTSGLSPWAALLSGEDAQKIGRDLTYLGYVAKARVELVQKLETEISRLDELKKKTADHQKTLDRLAEQTLAGKKELETEQKKYAAVLKKIEKDLTDRRSQAVKLAQDEKRLNSLIEDIQKDISRQLEQARLAKIAQEKAEAEKRREALRQKEQEAALAREQAARAAIVAKQAETQTELAYVVLQSAVVNQEKQTQVLTQAQQQVAQAQDEQQRQQARQQVQNALQQTEQARQELALARQQAENAEIERAKARIQKEKEEQAALLAQKAREDERRAAANAESGATGLQKGAPWPVRGTLQGRFGTTRPDTGGVWRGILISANEGTPVRAIAGGQVVFSSWVRGFGNLVIVDHGNNYMSVYGYNQSILGSVGDNVRAGQTIARVGSTGGQVDPALYFEIRNGSTPVDPLTWLSK